MLKHFERLRKSAVSGFCNRLPYKRVIERNKIFEILRNKKLALITKTTSTILTVVTKENKRGGKSWVNKQVDNITHCNRYAWGSITHSEYSDWLKAMS